MLKVGLTGGIACGKSTVARMLEEKGALLINADQLAREVVEPGQPAFHEIVSWLGNRVLAGDGSLDRSALAQIVFNDHEALSTLNTIVHSRVKKLFEERSRYLSDKHPACIQVWEIPLLFESAMQFAVNIIIVVASNEENQLMRLYQRNGLSRVDAVARIRSQLPIQQKITAADYVLYNDSTEDYLQKQVDLLWDELLGLQE